MMTLDEALMMCADNMRTTIDAEGFACAEDFALVCLAAEVRRLREELAEWKHAAGVAGITVGVLKEENERLRKDAGRYAKVHQHLSWQINPNRRATDSEVDAHADALIDLPQQNIDAARSES